jgi:hypothetical protein
VPSQAKEMPSVVTVYTIETQQTVQTIHLIITDPPSSRPPGKEVAIKKTLPQQRLGLSFLARIFTLAYPATA